MPMVDGHLVIDGYTYPGGDGHDKDNAIEITTFKHLIDADNDSDITSTKGNRYYYFKIVEDLYPSKEDFFTGYVTKCYWNNNYYFCDPNDRKKIDGLVVSGNTFISFSNSSQNYYPVFENIDIINSVFYYQAQSYGCAFGSTSNIISSYYYIKFIGCTVSVKLAPFAGILYSVIGSTCRFQQCSIYVSANSSNRPSTNYIIVQGFHYQTNIVFENFTINNFVNLMYFQQVSIILKHCLLTGSFMSGTSFVWTPPQTYVACIDCDYNLTNNAVYSNNYPTIIASDADPYPFTLSASTPNYAILATTVDSTDPNFNTSSVKSKQFMIDSGFLP